MRIDKYLKVCRILKRRTVGKSACDGGRVSVNGKEVKPSYDVKVGDAVSLRLGGKELKFRVLAVKDFAKANECENMYEIITE